MTDAHTAAARPSAAPSAAPTDATSENLRKSPTFHRPEISEAVPAPESLSHRQVAALVGLIAGKTLSAVAKEVGISPRTLYEWRRDPAFAAELSRRSAEALDAGSIRAGNLMLRSTDLLAETLRGDDRYRWAFRVATSKRIWDMAQQLPSREMFTESTSSTPAASPDTTDRNTASGSPA